MGGLLAPAPASSCPGNNMDCRLHQIFMVVLLFGVASAAQAGTYNKQLNIGDAAPDWSGLVGTDEKKHSLTDLKGKEVVVICFTCNTCPYAVDYEDRLIALAKKFAAEDARCALVAINANKVKDDLLPAMQERAKSKGFNFPYLHDESQQVARATARHLRLNSSF